MTAGIQVIGRPMLLGGERIEHVGRHGQTILQMIEEGIGAPLDEAARRRGRVLIGGKVIPPELWHRVRPKPGTILNFTLGIPQGGNIFRSILILAVVVAAAWAGPLVAGWALGTTAAAVAAGTAGVSAATFGAASALATGVIGFAGMTLINAIVPMRPPALTGNSPSPTYSIAGGRNIANPYGPVPVILGRHRVSPLYAARPYTEVVGTKQYLRQVFVIGYGPLSLQDIKIGETPIGEYDDVEIEIREGLPTDAPISLYPGQVLEDQFSIRLEEGADFSVRRSSADADELSVDWAFPQGLVKYSSKGKPRETSGIVAIEMRRVGTADWVPVATIDTSEKKEEPFRVGHRWVVARGQYDVRMRCVQDESQAQNIEWSALRTIRAKPPFTFPFPLALIAVRILAQGQLNGIIDELNCIASSRCPDWDTATGGWITRETSSPASLFRYTQQHPGNARRLSDAQIAPILPDLQSWHDYCRPLGLEFNMVRDAKAALPDVLADIAATGHATTHWRDGLRSVVIDRPRTTVVQMVTPENSWGFEGQQNNTDLPDAWRIRFVDRQANWDQNAERIVPRQGFTEETAQDFETAEFPGETDARRIYIDGRRRFEELEKRAQTCSVNMDWESLQATRGDLVLVGHDVPRWGLSWGRVKRVDQIEAMSIVTLSAPVEMTAGKTYVIRFRKPEQIQGTLLRQVMTMPGENRVVRLVGPGPLPKADDLYLFGEPGKEAREMVVKEIEPGDALNARLILVDHAPEIEDAEDEEPPVWVPREPTPQDDSPAVPVIVSVASGPNVQGVGDDGTVLAAIAVGLAPGAGSPIPAARYLLQHRLAGTTAWTPVDIPAAVAGARLLGYSPGDTVEMMAQAFSAANKPSLFSPMITHVMQARTTPAPDVATFTVERLATGVRRFTWTFADPDGSGLPPDLVGARIKYRSGPGPWTWAELNPLHGGLLTAQVWETAEPGPAGNYTFGIVGVLRSGNESANPKQVNVDLGPGITAQAPTISTPAGVIGYSNPLIAGTADPGASVKVFVDGTQAPGTVTADLAGNWTKQLTGLLAGPRIVAATQTVNGANSGPSNPIVLTVQWQDPDASGHADFKANRGWLLGAAAALTSIFDVITTSAQLVTFGDGSLKVCAANTLPLSDQGLELWEPRTNRLAHSNAAPTGITGVTPGGDAAATLTAPDQTATMGAGSRLAGVRLGGTLNGTVYRLDNTAGTTDAHATIAGTVVDTTPHAASAFVRGDNGRIEIGGVAVSTFAAAADWTRVSGVRTPAVATEQMRIVAPAGKVVSFILAQLEKGAFVSAPIVVAGAAATRNAPLIQRTVTSDFNASEGFLGVRAKVVAGVTNSGIVFGSLQTSTSDANLIQFVTATSLRGLTQVAGAPTASPTQALAATNMTTGVYGYKANDFAFAANGLAAVADTSGAVPTGTPAKLTISINAGTAVNGIVEQVKWGIAKPANAAIQAKSGWAPVA